MLTLLKQGDLQDIEKLELLRNSSYFRVEVSILCGRELIAMDRGGTSDPYVLIRWELLDISDFY